MTVFDGLELGVESHGSPAGWALWRAAALQAGTERWRLGWYQTYFPRNKKGPIVILRTTVIKYTVQRVQW